MKNKLFLPLLLLVACGGLIIRLYHYDRLPPFGETKDEFMYPWAGISLLKTGTPTSWAFFGAYPLKEKVTYWGTEFLLVSPWLDKPPLYPLLTATASLLSGEDEFHEVRLSTIRLVPIFLSFFSIFFSGLVAAEIFGKKVGVIASLLYATVPTIVMANRLSLTENLLVPLSLFTLWVFLIGRRKKWQWWPYVAGLGCGLLLLTKNTGVALPISLVSLLALEKRWREAAVVGVITGVAALVHPLMGLYYDWPLYVRLMNEYRSAMNVGRPETIASLFLFPVIGHKEKIFLDGGMLSGYILFLAAPFWLQTHRSQAKPVKSLPEFLMPQPTNIWILLLFPYLYLTMLSLLVGGQTWFGWHLFPLFPFLMILIAKALVGLAETVQTLQYVFFHLTIGASTLRFVMLIRPETVTNWPYVLGISLVSVLALIIINWQKPKLVQLLLVVLLGLYLLGNVYTVTHLNLIYPGRVQPPNGMKLSTSVNCETAFCN